MRYQGFLFCCLFLIHNCLSAQYKKIILPDSFPYSNISTFSASEIIESGIPGREIAISGTVAGTDSFFFGYQNPFLLQLNRAGQPQNFSMFEDQAPFLTTGSRSYSVCYDGTGNFYHALGSNNKQIVIKMNQNGGYEWSRAVNHHEFFDIVWNGTSAALFGQDEPTGGDHDFSLVKFDSAGNSSPGSMFGTPGFEIPGKFIYKNNYYVMAGSSYQNSVFELMVIKADTALNQVWGKYWGVPNVRLTAQDICFSNDTRGYLLTGYTTGNQNDSLLIVKMDTSGNIAWSKVYGLNGTAEIQGMSITPCGNSGYLVSGAYRGSVYRRPFVMRIDESGVPIWARDYADGESNKEEILSSILMSQTDGFFYAAGEYTQVDSLLISRAVLLIKALPDSGITPCDSALSFSSGNINLTLTGTTLSTGFSGSVPVLFAENTGQMKVETRCSLITRTEPGQENILSLIFTNPVSETCEIETNVPWGTADLEIFSLDGKLVYTKKIGRGNGKYSLNMNEINNGLYLIRINCEGLVSQTGRLLVIKN